MDLRRIKRLPRAGRVALLVGLLVSMVSTSLTACQVATPKRVLVFGDSIAFEASAQLAQRGLEVHAYGGTAICDWFPEMRKQAATTTVKTVYLEFVGNYFTTCVRTRPQVAAYQQDALTAVNIWRNAHVRVIWVRPPQPQGVAPTVPAPTPTPTPTGSPTTRPTTPATPVPSATPTVPTPTTPTPTTPAPTTPAPTAPTPTTPSGTPTETPTVTPTGTPVPPVPDVPIPTDPPTVPAQTPTSAEPSATATPEATTPAPDATTPPASADPQPTTTSTPAATDPSAPATQAPDPTATPDPSATPEPTATPVATPALVSSMRAVVLQTVEVTFIELFNEVQAAEQAARPDAYVDTSRLIAPNRVWTRYLPCRTGEPCGVLAPKGYDAARAPDGLHLCPTQGQTVNGVVTGCSVYSISAVRFAEQVAGTT